MRDVKVSGPTLVQVRRDRAEALAGFIAIDTGIPVSAILGRVREPDVVAARHRLFSELYATGLSFSAIGRCLGFDHTTVLYAVNKYRAVHPPKRVA